MPPAPYAAALTEHPDPGQAVAELVGHALERLEAEPDLAVLLTTGMAPDRAARLAGAVQALLRPAVLVGAGAGGLIAGDGEADGVGAACLLAARTGPVRALRLPPAAPAPTVPDGRVAVVLAAGDAAVGSPARPAPPTGGGPRARPAAAPVVGGVVEGAGGAGGRPSDRPWLLLDGAVVSEGAVGVVLPQGSSADALVLPACRPIGPLMTVTGAEGPLVRELAGRAASVRLGELIDEADEELRARLERGVVLGRVLDESLEDPGPGDFVLADVVRGDRHSRGLLVEDGVPVGATVRFHVHDPDWAAGELARRLIGRRADAALVFADRGWLRGGFGTGAHHRASRHLAAIGAANVAGIRTSGPIGPAPAGPGVHPRSASVLLLSAPEAGAGPRRGLG